MVKDIKGPLFRTFYLTLEDDDELRRVAVDTDRTEQELIRELLAEGIKKEYSRYPALKEALPASVTDGDFPWAWLPGHTVKKTVVLSPEEDYEVRRIAFAQGRIAGNLFRSFVMDALKRRRPR
ncbi:hypothetical protein ACFL26_01780 [Patescibacteria group bacterium]